MTWPVVALRPQPGCAATVVAARQLGLDAIEAPLFAIEPVRWSAPEPNSFDGILAGSANAFRCGGEALSLLTSSCVGWSASVRRAAIRSATDPLASMFMAPI